MKWGDGMFFKIVSYVLMIFGAVTFACIMSELTKGAWHKIKCVMARQNKIRFLCRHEYEFIYSWYYMDDMEEANYKCRKCGKELVIKRVYKG